MCDGIRRFHLSLLNWHKSKALLGCWWSISNNANFLKSSFNCNFISFSLVPIEKYTFYFGCFQFTPTEFRRVYINRNQRYDIHGECNDFHCFLSFYSCFWFIRSTCDLPNTEQEVSSMYNRWNNLLQGSTRESGSKRFQNNENCLAKFRVLAV